MTKDIDINRAACAAIEMGDKFWWEVGEMQNRKALVSSFKPQPLQDGGFTHSDCIRVFYEYLTADRQWDLDINVLSIRQALDMVLDIKKNNAHVWVSEDLVVEEATKIREELTQRAEATTTGRWDSVANDQKTAAKKLTDRLSEQQKWNQVRALTFNKK